MIWCTRQPTCRAFKNKELFQIAQMDRPRVGGVRLLDWCTRQPTHRALKARSCSGLNLWTNFWSLKNKEVFLIRLVDHPHVGGLRLVDRPCVEPLKRGVALDWTRIELY